MSARPIVIIGSMAFDDLEFPRPTVDPADPTAKRLEFENVIGGSATYGSLAASCFAPVRAVAVVGDDFPEPVLERLRARGVDTTGVERAHGKTFRWKGRYHQDLVGRDTIDTQLNVFAEFEPHLPESYRDSPQVLLGNIHPALQLEVLEQVRAPELVVADTMNFWISGEPQAVARLLRRINLLVINDEEARLLSGEHNLLRAARAIMARGPARLIIKRGEHGAVYLDAQGMFLAPALLLDDVADPTGAGDAFAGGLMGSLAEAATIDHRAMRRAMVAATATASFCVQAVGPGRLFEIDRAAVSARAGEYLRLTQLEPSGHYSGAATCHGL